jgi:hypothetical protein
MYGFDRMMYGIDRMMYGIRGVMYGLTKRLELGIWRRQKRIES